MLALSQLQTFSPFTFSLFGMLTSNRAHLQCLLILQSLRMKVVVVVWLMIKITVVYWKWNMNPSSLHREPLKGQFLPPCDRGGNQDSERRVNFPCVHTADDWLSRDSVSGVRHHSLCSGELCSSIRRNSTLTQLLISLIPLRNGADCSLQHSTTVDAVGSFSSDFNCVSLHFPPLDCRPFEVMSIWSPSLSP